MSVDGFGDPAYEIFDSLGENKENDAAGWLLLASLDKLIEDRSELLDKINPCLASHLRIQRRTTLNVVTKLAPDVPKQSKRFQVCPGRESFLYQSQSSCCRKSN